MSNEKLLAIAALLGISLLLLKRNIERVLPLFKSGVNIDALNPITDRIMLAAQTVAESLGFDRSTITSGNDGNHMPGSKHYTGEALDIRRLDRQLFGGTASYTDPILAQRQTNMLARELGEDFDVILEPDHIHAEYDPATRLIT